MYLHKKTYIGAHFEHCNVKGVIDLTQGKDDKVIPIRLNRISEIVEQVGYWRKANHIHQWFVANVQDGKDECVEHYVSKEDLEKLLSAVHIALKHKGFADKILPTASGFFFGGTDYDDYYFQDLEDTKVIVEACLQEGGNYYYKSSW